MKKQWTFATETKVLKCPVTEIEGVKVLRKILRPFNFFKITKDILVIFGMQ